MRKFFNFNLSVSIVLFIISLILVLIWLPTKVVLAGGDIGIPIFNPQKISGVQSHAWWDTHATGITSPVTYTAMPFYLILSVFEKIGLTPDLLQKILFFTILFGGSLSLYFLALNLSFKQWTAFLSALFYIFNLTSLSVWQRGVHNAMLMLLLAPLSLLILVWGIRKKKYYSIILINVVSFLLSYVYGALGYIFSLWLLWTFYICITLIDNWRDKSLRRFILIYFSILFVSWIGTNLWWIFHFLVSSNYALGQFTPEELKARGSDVLVGLKPYHEPAFILRGLSRYYHYVVQDWGSIYLSPFFIVLSWVPTLIVFSTTLFKENFRSTVWKFLVTLTVVVFMLSKGINSPLGDLNKTVFDSFYLLAPLRNTYEKVGILLIIPFSLLFALGTNQIINLLRARRINYLSPFIFLSAVLCLTILVWPLWAGKLFVSEGRKYAVPIPDYYGQANDWLKEEVKIDDTRILHLPLAWGESIDYDWGYTGIEPSQYFFNGSSIGYHLGISSVDSRLRDLLINIHNQDSLNIQKSLASLNVGWVVLHNEILYRDRILESPERIKEWLSKKPYFLEYVKDIGPLSIWRVKDEYRVGHIYSAGKLTNINKTQKLSSLQIWDQIENLNDGFFTEIQPEHEEILNQFINESLIFPQNKIKYESIAFPGIESALRDVAIVKYLPDSLFYPLVTIKGKIISFLNQDDSVRYCFSLSGKKLLESILLVRQNKFAKAKETFIKYREQFDQCESVALETLAVYLNTPQFRDEILRQLINQKVLLEMEFGDPKLDEERIKAKNELKEYFVKLGLSTKYESTQVESNKQLIAYSYQVPHDGEYSIELNNPSKIVQIDDRAVNITKFVYPAFEFSKGFHEIFLSSDLGDNLIEEALEKAKTNPTPGFVYEEDPVTKEGIFTAKASDSLVSLKLDLNNLNPEGSYEVSFDVYFVQGAPITFTITHDTDPTDSTGNQKSAIKRDLYFADNPIQWRNVRINYTPSLNASMAKIGFSLIPWNECMSVHPWEQCIGLDPKQVITNPTVIKFRNIKVEKILDSTLVLKDVKQSTSQELGKADIRWNKKNAVLYEMTLSNQITPYVLVFSETFHPQWEITDMSGQKIELPHFSINGFANGWLIENPLPEEIKIRFVLQNALTYGILISVAIFIASSLLLIYLQHVIIFRSKKGLA